MKKLSTTLVVTAIIIFASSCKKTSSSNSTVSQWNFNGTNYQGTTTIATSGELGTAIILEANDVKDTVTNFVLVGFASKPVNNEKFSIITSGTTPDSTSCTIITGSVDSTQVPILLGQSAGTTDSVTVTIVNGKYHVSFTDVPMEEYKAIFTSLSGTLIEQ